MKKIKSKPGLTNYFNSLPEEVRVFFRFLPRLIEGFPLDVALAYVFAEVELAHRSALYCGIVKLHRGHSDLAYKAVQKHDLTRAQFRQMYAAIYGKSLPKEVTDLLTVAEAARDHVMHGKTATDDQKRNAIAHALAYAVPLNEQTVSAGGPRPFGDLRGFKGAAHGLDKNTTRWMLLGMGFLKKVDDMATAG